MRKIYWKVIEGPRGWEIRISDNRELVEDHKGVQITCDDPRTRRDILTKYRNDINKVEVF